MKLRQANPPNPWSSTHVEYLGEPPEAELKVYEEDAKSVLSHNTSPDLDFAYSVNPYRGCFHGCAYCYARPTHQYLGFGAGTDFDRKIIVKRNAPELLAAALRRPSWRKQTIVFSGVTDCYQPLEASYQLTRRCLQVCRDKANPVGVITKGALVCRDVDVLSSIAERASARVFMSIAFTDRAMSKAMEPGTNVPDKRFRALEQLSEAGLTTGIALAPVIVGLNDEQIPELLRRAADAGASRAFMTLLRLPAEVGPVFTERLQAELPLRASRVMSQMADVRKDRLDEGRFGVRHRGVGARWKIVEQMFDATCRRLGLVNRELEDDCTSEPTTAQEQMDLF